MRRLTVTRVTWPLREPFVISRQSYDSSQVVVVELRSGSYTGRGEASGVDYHGETPDGLVAQIESVRAAIEAGANRSELQRLLPAGGARNALDAALWDLEAKETGMSIREGLALISRAMPNSSGIKIATTGVLLIKAEKIPTAIMTAVRASK